ncbi:MAG: DUF1893 domain-containing protein [Ruminococcaceae bacterium]|nr:DUF1893 domain-containing protein [Oscillospiraceae bacterium]
MIFLNHKAKDVDSVGNNYKNQAKVLLSQSDHTFVLCGPDVTIADNRRGVRPLLDLWEQHIDVSSCAAADKVVGKGAAYLYLLLNIRCLYAQVISQPALAVLTEANIPVEFDLLVPAIQNRAKNGFCPIETAVWSIQDPTEALSAIYKTIEALNK